MTGFSVITVEATYIGRVTIFVVLSVMYRSQLRKGVQIGFLGKFPNTL